MNMMCFIPRNQMKKKINIKKEGVSKVHDTPSFLMFIS